jgi:hypothetical protein
MVKYFTCLEVSGQLAVLSEKIQEAQTDTAKAEIMFSTMSYLEMALYLTNKELTEYEDQSPESKESRGIKAIEEMTDYLNLLVFSGFDARTILAAQSEAFEPYIHALHNAQKALEEAMKEIDVTK